MKGATLMGVAIIGGGLLWYMNSQSPTSTLPTTTTPASTITNTDGSTTTTNTDGTTTTTATDGTVTTTDADGTVIDTTEGSDDSSTVDPTDCSKYRKSQHGKSKVWMNSTKTDSFDDGWYRPDAIRMRHFETQKEQYFVEDVVNWELDISVKNVSRTWCGGYTTGKRCWLPPSSTGDAAGGNCCVGWSVTWTDYEGRSYTDDSGTITRPAVADNDPWSVLKGTFRIPNTESSNGRWKCEIKYWWTGSDWGTHEDGEVTWSGNVFRAVPKSCDDTVTTTTVGRAENFASDFTRPMYAPAVSHQSFMQF